MPKVPKTTIKEAQEQAYLFNWAKWNVGQFPELDEMFAIPNGAGKLSKQTCAKLKRTGLKAGVPDIFLPAIRGGYGGMFIELKSMTGTVQDNQMDWKNRLERNGYFCIIAKGWISAMEQILKYLKGEYVKQETK